MGRPGSGAAILACLSAPAASQYQRLSRRASGISVQAMLLPRAYFVQQKVFQHVSSLAAWERLTTEATGYLVPNGRLPSRNLDNVVKRLALRTVEERPIVHSQLASRPRFFSASERLRGISRLRSVTKPLDLLRRIDPAADQLNGRSYFLLRRYPTPSQHGLLQRSAISQNARSIVQRRGPVSVDLDFVIVAHQRAQSSSASRFTAGAAGFLTFIQSAERPNR
jgi:hypothetical protein